MTRAYDPGGSVLDAAVISFELKVSPVLVRWPLRPGPYHEASVVCPLDVVLVCTTGGGTGGNTGERETPHPPTYNPIRLMSSVRFRAEDSNRKTLRGDMTRTAFPCSSVRETSAPILLSVRQQSPEKAFDGSRATFHLFGLKMALLSTGTRGRKVQDGRAMILREREPRNPA